MVWTGGYGYISIGKASSYSYLWRKERSINVDTLSSNRLYISSQTNLILYMNRSQKIHRINSLDDKPYKAYPSSDFPSEYIGAVSHVEECTTSATRFSLHDSYCTILHCTTFTVQPSLHDLHCTTFTARLSLHDSHCTILTVPYLLYDSYYTTPYIVHHPQYLLRSSDHGRLFT